MIRMRYFFNKCDKCGAQYKSLQDVDEPWVFAATIKGEEVFINPDYDPIWGEVSQLVKEILDEFNLHSRDKARAFHNAFMLTLDPSPSGEPYYMWGMTLCRKCGSSEGLHYGPMGPNEPPVEIEPKIATHRQWEKLTQEEKKEKVKGAVFDYLKRRKEELRESEERLKKRGLI